MAQVNEATTSTTAAAAGGRRRNPRGQGEKLRHEILAAVGRLLDEKLGDNALPVSLREVAREVGIAAQSMYLHFSDKDQLALAVAEDGYQRVVTAMREADAGAAAAGAGADVRLRAQSDAFCDFARTNRGVFRLMFGHDAARFGPAGHGHPARVLWEQWLAAVVACEEAGARWPDGARHTATHLWSALLGRVALWAGALGEDDPEALHAFTDRTVEALLRDAR
ncbi:TetR/AcrR family transcriptional regulator [Streptomyces sp. 2A115]|uniref:TetR/AcrR family transcriptional regulator n=1 Tax=Streptomyces sp. 2A115 TaxID=3457439 RepID=UPI003FCF5DF5